VSGKYNAIIYERPQSSMSP